MLAEVLFPLLSKQDSLQQSSPQLCEPWQEIGMAAIVKPFAVEMFAVSNKTNHLAQINTYTDICSCLEYSCIIQ